MSANRPQWMMELEELLDNLSDPGPQPTLEAPYPQTNEGLLTNMRVSGAQPQEFQEEQPKMPTSISHQPTAGRTDLLTSMSAVNPLMLELDEILARMPDPGPQPMEFMKMPNPDSQPSMITNMPAPCCPQLMKSVPDPSPRPSREFSKMTNPCPQLMELLKKTDSIPEPMEFAKMPTSSPQLMTGMSTERLVTVVVSNPQTTDLLKMPEPGLQLIALQMESTSTSTSNSQTKASKEKYASQTIGLKGNPNVKFTKTAPGPMTIKCTRINRPTPIARKTAFASQSPEYRVASSRLVTPRNEMPDDVRRTLMDEYQRVKFLLQNLGSNEMETKQAIGFRLRLKILQNRLS